MSTIIGTPGSGGGYVSPPPSSGGGKILALYIAVVVLAGASGYELYQLHDMAAKLDDTRESLLAEINRVHETSTVSTATSKRSVDALKGEVDAARRQASLLAGQAKIDATKHADELAESLKKAQDEAALKVNAVTAEVSQVKEDATATRNKVGEVNTEVGSLKTEQATTRSELEKTIADLKSTKGDLGVQSGLIATNGKELSALRALGERNYFEFKLAKNKTAQKVGDVQIRLKAADPKRNRYTIELIADDKMVEKKDKTINEPVQFLLSRAMQPYELVVNEVRKDMIVGYVASPKVQQARK